MPAEIGELSDIHLLYMGPGHFAEIKTIHAPNPGAHTTNLPSTSNKSVTPNNCRGVMPNGGRKSAQNKQVTN